MRILLVTDFYHPYNGGVEVHVQTVAESLAARGHEVAVATMPTRDDQPERPIDGPVTILPVSHLTARVGRAFANAGRPWAPPFPDPLAMWGLRRAVRSFRPDVIHGHDWLARSVLPRMVSGRIPVVTSLHYYTRTCAKKTLWRHHRPCSGPGLIQCLRCAGDHYGLAKGTAVTLGLRVGSALEDRRSATRISVSAATEAGNRLGNERSVVIANPLTPEAVQPAAGRPAADAAVLPPPVADLLPEGPFLLYVGDLRPEKGIHVLLAAVTRLRRHHGNALPLVLVGERTTDGLDLPANTVEVGPVDHAVVQALWRRATIAAVPSLWPEPFGLVAIEAMAGCCPVVASDIAGLAEILGPGPDGRDRGVLVPPGDHAALAAAVDELSHDPDRRRTLAEAAAASLDRYAVGDIVDAIEAEYRAAVG